MNTAGRLGVYGAGLAVVFGGAFVAADAVVPQRTVDNWTVQAKGHSMNTQHNTAGAGTHGGHEGAAGSATQATTPGVTSAEGGYLLSPVTAPATLDKAGNLSFRILNNDGEAVTDFATSHEKKLHLIVVRTDGTRFRHVHPTMDTDGTWSLPWQWAEAGTYRVYADFVPAAEGASTTTLTRTVDVAGRFSPAPPAPTKTATVDEFTVELTGDVVAGSTADLSFTVTKDGKPVEALQPYLGAFGHLVALREGDLAYLHVHPEGDEPSAGELSGPEIGFMAEAPTAGRYLLYLDFQVDGQVHSAAFVVDTTGQDDHSNMGSDTGHESGSESGDDHSHSH